MLLLRIGLLLATAGGLYASVASFTAGYPPEVAIVRGVVAWVVIALVGYVSELIVVGAAPRPADPSHLPSAPVATRRVPVEDDEPMVG